MLVTPNFVFVHLPKTGGRFCREIITEYAAPILHTGEFHGHIAQLPPQYRTLPIIAFIRNPWDWYVSWVFHMVSHGAFNPLFGSAIKSGETDFNGIMTHVLDSIDAASPAGAALDQHLASPEHLQMESHALDANMVAFLRERQCGLLTWRYLFNVGEDDGVEKKIGRFEHLRPDLISLLGECGTNLSAAQRDAILTRNAVGVSEHRRGKDYRTFYRSQRLIDYVAERERYVIEKFGYRFE